MEKDVSNRVSEIDRRISDLESHIAMWGRAGAGNMAMQALAEIADLKLEKEDLLNGTNKLEISKTTRELNRLKFLKEEAGLIKRIQYNFQIKKVEGELKNLQNKSVKK